MALFQAPHRPLNRAHWALTLHRHAAHAVSAPTLGKVRRRAVWRSRCPGYRQDEAGLESADLSKEPNDQEAGLAGEELSVQASSQGDRAASSEQGPSEVLPQEQGVQEMLRFAVPALGECSKRSVPAGYLYACDPTANMLVLLSTAPWLIFKLAGFPSKLAHASKTLAKGVRCCCG